MSWFEFAYDGPAGCRLDYYLRERFKPFSRTVWHRRVAEGLVLVNGRRVHGSRRMREGDTLRIDPSAAGPEPAPGGIRIIHEDDDLIAVVKDSGILVHPVRLMTRDTVVGFLRERYGEAYPCHRLDKLTSGIVLFARHADCARKVQAAFEAGDVSKEYLALVEGAVAPESGRISAPLGPDTDSPVRIRVTVREDGEPSVTDFRVLERFAQHTLLAVQLLTGRKHQIRAHLAHAGHPIHGDFLYGREIDVDYFENRQVNLARDSERWIALHAMKLELQHPTREGVRITLEAEPPERFQALLDELRSRG